jgi:hypothetical protein
VVNTSGKQAVECLTEDYGVILSLSIFLVSIFTIFRRFFYLLKIRSVSVVWLNSVARESRVLGGQTSLSVDCSTTVVCSAVTPFVDVRRWCFCVTVVNSRTSLVVTAKRAVDVFPSCDDATLSLVRQTSVECICVVEG